MIQIMIPISLFIILVLIGLVLLKDIQAERANIIALPEKIRIPISNLKPKTNQLFPKPKTNQLFPKPETNRIFPKPETNRTHSKINTTPPNLNLNSTAQSSGRKTVHEKLKGPAAQGEERKTVYEIPREPVAQSERRKTVHETPREPVAQSERRKTDPPKDNVINFKRPLETIKSETSGLHIAFMKGSTLVEEPLTELMQFGYLINDGKTVLEIHGIAAPKNDKKELTVNGYGVIFSLDRNGNAFVEPERGNLTLDGEPLKEKRPFFIGSVLHFSSTDKVELRFLGENDVFKSSNRATNFYLHKIEGLAHLPKKIELSTTRILIGSFPEEKNSLQISKAPKKMSRRHAYIWKSGGFAFIKDISSNGVKVNGEKLLKKQPCCIALNSRVRLSEGAIYRLIGES